MRLTWDELRVRVDGATLEALLAPWRWLATGELVPFLVSTAGDLFVEDACGRVLRLDTGAGRLDCIAPSRAAFEREASRPANANEWLLAQFVGNALASGVELAPGECLGFEIPPVLGGDAKLENVRPENVVVHFTVTAHAHAALRGARAEEASESPKP